MNIKNYYKPTRNDHLKPYTLQFLFQEGLIGSPRNPGFIVTDFEIYNSGIVDVLLEYPYGHFYTIEAPEKLKHLIIEDKLNVGDSISIYYDKSLNRFEVIKNG